VFLLEGFADRSWKVLEIWQLLCDFCCLIRNLAVFVLSFLLGIWTIWLLLLEIWLIFCVKMLLFYLVFSSWFCQMFCCFCLEFGLFGYFCLKFGLLLDEN